MRGRNEIYPEDSNIVHVHTNLFFLLLKHIFHSYNIKIIKVILKVYFNCTKTLPVIQVLSLSRDEEGSLRCNSLNIGGTWSQRDTSISYFYESR